MKTRFLILLTLLAATAVPGQAQQMEFLPDGSPPPLPGGADVKYTLLKPEDKTSETVKEGEHNPYGKSDVEMRNMNQKGTNEENEIRERLEKLRVVGVSPGARGLRVMLGDMVLEPGLFVPQILPDQSLMLRVAHISTEAIELVWVEKKPTGLPARSMIITVDLRPYVRYKLMGQPTDKNQWEKEKSGGAGAVPVGVRFPEVAQTPASSTVQVAQNTKVPRAEPVADESPRAAGGTASSAAPAAPATPEVKPNPQWEKAMSLLDKILPKEGAKP